MDIDIYRSFLAISDSGSFTAAAKQVGRTQSAVSQQIKKLEELIGHPVFERGAGAIALTEYGKSLLAPARNIVDTHSDAMAAFKRGSFEGLVVLGIPDGYVRRILADVMRVFSTLFPAATLNTVIADSPTLAAKVAEGSVDLTFITDGAWPARGPVVFCDRLVIAGPAQGDLHLRDPLPLAVWDERAFDHRLMIEVLEKMGRGYRIACICRSVYGKHAAITAGLCASVMVESSLIDGERVYGPEDGFPILQSARVLLECAHVKRSTAVTRFADKLEEFFSAQAADGIRAASST